MCGRYILPYFVKIFDKPILNILSISTLYLFIIAFGLEMEQNTIILLVTAMFIFAIFINLKIKSNVINKIAKHSIGVYLIHDNVNVRNEIIVKKLNIFNSYKSKYFFISTLSMSILIFIICTIIDYLVSLIIEKIIFKNNKTNERIAEINLYVNNFENNESSNK